MVRLREFDKEEALRAAMRVFWEKGFEAASLNDLTEAMAIQRPSLYLAFGDKEQLFEQALRKYTQWHASNVREKLHSKSSVRDAFYSYFMGLVDESYQGESSPGCFCINAMVELAHRNQKFEIITREHQTYLAALFQEEIERGIRSGELNKENNAKALAQGLVVSLIGITVMLKAKPDRSFIENAVGTAIALL
ncbi:TetR/AcrR family transcriptional regulator [Paenibacillus rhizovicinus]|uniref:TetR/AcrR family transcriptional regulator n=1 Tax=Paenibacillus rhizovicinus TaxID=2704463 RepID=A0A6C0P623_9BACL|nr:TetR/AcrR family transcriptional regulator [Paenibacillus rhizovicinus]QHW33766.1 TetR/AcrR family transcriptional regulator [Paenibacillus rhizovicinus]